MSKIRVRVTGKYEVGGAVPGQEVYLDPDKVNVSELIRTGMVEPLDTEAPAPAERSGQTRSAKKAADEPGEKAH